MALTIKEQLDIVSGFTNPPETDFKSMIHQISFIQAKEFYDTHKVFDKELAPDAGAYLDKMLGVCHRVISYNNNITDVLCRISAVIVGESAVTGDQITNATQTQWENFFKNNMEAAFEYVAGVTLEHKTEYLAQP